VTVVAGMTLAFTIAFGRDALRRIVANFYGLVTGVEESDPESPVALSVWLEEELEQIAGLAPGTPLTFGMLWDAQRDPEHEGLDAMPDDPDVNLEMITTNVTWGRPYKFPLETSRFGFIPRDFLAFFPRHVVAWMIVRSRNVASRAVPIDHDQPIAFPKMADVPVIVATRMSLAFPILLSAVPVYAALREGEAYQRCWFSDGGISSNFPITLFDAPLPRWPTFGIDLSALPDGQKLSDDESKNIFMPPNNAAPFPTWTRINSLPGFLSSVLDVMQNWNDNTQSVLPGYRDRIVTVYLDQDEGGLNLDMPPALLHRLCARGAAAGAELVARFEAPSILAGGSPQMNWENHRWLRYRSTMAALRSYLTSFTRGLGGEVVPDVPYMTLVAATAGLPACEYSIEEKSRAAVIELTNNLETTGNTIALLATLGEDVPQPLPQLDLRPHVDA
jgi:Patatin-like phospholipase